MTSCQSGRKSEWDYIKSLKGSSLSNLCHFKWCSSYLAFDPVYLCWSAVYQSYRVSLEGLNHIPSLHGAPTPLNLRESDQDIDTTHVETIKPDKSNPMGSVTNDKSPGSFCKCLNEHLKHSEYLLIYLYCQRYSFENTFM